MFLVLVGFGSDRLQEGPGFPDGDSLEEDLEAI